MTLIQQDKDLVSWLVSTGFLEPKSLDRFFEREDIKYYGRSDEGAAPEGLLPLFHHWGNALAPSLCAQAMAVYLQENPDLVAGRNCLDVAGGSGIVAVAAAKAGASAARLIDLRGAQVAIKNAELNGIADKISVTKGNIFAPENRRLFREASVITLCSFHSFETPDVEDILLEEAARGATILVCAYQFADTGWEKTARRGVPVRARAVPGLYASGDIVMHKLG